VKPDKFPPVDPAELSLRGVIEAAADADWEQARDILLGDMVSELRRQGHDGGHVCKANPSAWPCSGCDLIGRYEALTKLSTQVLGNFRARFGDLGGGTA
jgi:hypothetical protein